ncbi:MAG: HAD hydrolase family protein [Phycisphaerae bacterium]|nr:HAD hydrolase family protein [Phycisphaerae bacterium]
MSEVILARIRCLILDVDGTLTDGLLHVDAETGVERRSFHVHDGFAIRLFQQAGGEVVICTGKGGGSIQHRARLLRIEHLIETSADKLADVSRLLDTLGITLHETAFMGDDLPDIAVMRQCVFPIAPANARPEVRAIAKLVTEARGGEGAVREAIEFLMRETGDWDDVLRRFDAEC